MRLIFVCLIFFLILSTAAASAAVDPLALNTTGDLDELEALLAGGEIGLVNRSAGEGIMNASSSPAESEPPFLHLIRNESIFRDFENLTGPVIVFPISAESAWNGSFFDRLIEEWW